MKPTVDQLWQQFLDRAWLFLTDEEMWLQSLWVLIRVLLIFIVSRIVLWLINRMIDRVTGQRGRRAKKLRIRRTQTMARLLKNVNVYAINIITFLLVLGEFDVNLTPLLAGAGVVGLAIGFGAQTLVKDLIGGVFILMEDQFAVGDVVRIGGATGTVEMIGLRTTRLRSWTGEVHIIPNGSITQVTNYSVYPSLAVVDVTVPTPLRVEEAGNVIRGVLDRFDDAAVIGRPELLGLQAVDAAGAVLRVAAACRPDDRLAVARRLNEAIRKAFEERGENAAVPRIAALSPE